MISKNKGIGIITEQGDLGLGFDPLSKKDNKQYNKSLREEGKNEQKVHEKSGTRIKSS